MEKYCSNCEHESIDEYGNFACKYYGDCLEIGKKNLLKHWEVKKNG